ncbi:MAG: rhodanese-like domain-containing protein [Armatimonadia bacterium]
MAREIAADELRARMTDEDDDFLLVDLMPPSQYLLLHIPTAVNIPIDYLHQVIEYLPHERDIVLYCTDPECEFTKVGARKLELHGFTNVVMFHGGLEEWEKYGYPFATVLLNQVRDHEDETERPAPAGAKVPAGAVPASK